MNWDDLRIAMAVHKCGSYSGASAELRVDETTVARRLARLQRDLGVPLFEAVDGARKPTAQCEEILTHVAQIAQHVERIGDVGTTCEGPVGHYRIAATDSIAAEVLGPKIARFLSGHPGIRLQIITSTENVNFSRWQADIAIRLKKPDKGDFVISKLADMGLYLIEPVDIDSPNGGRMVCGYPEDLDLTPESQYMSAAGLLPVARCLTKNLLVAKALIRSRACCGILPGYMCAEFRGDDTLKLTRLDATREAWLLVQDHLKHDPATRVVIDWIRDCFATV